MNAPLLPALPGYEDPELVAHGTTALVFRAVQTRVNRLVAIKVITVDATAAPVNAARELATTVRLSSQPHIVSIIDTGTTQDDRPYIVMEYCEGGSYAHILKHHGPLPVDDVVEVGIKIGQALHAAHLAGIVHRDVKPSNILRSQFGPALTDFGIARAPDELSGTLTREMMTPRHASPEALVQQAQSGLSDVYSLASTMWTLLVGHPPFLDPTQPAPDLSIFRDQVLHDPLPPMPRPDVPGWLVAELRRAMAKLPAQRHGSAQSFAESLQRGALGIPTMPRRGRHAAEPDSAPDLAPDLATGPTPEPAISTWPAAPAVSWPPESTSAPHPAPPAPVPVPERAKVPEWAQEPLPGSEQPPRAPAPAAAPAGAEPWRQRFRESDLFPTASRGGRGRPASRGRGVGAGTVTAVTLSLLALGGAGVLVYDRIGSVTPPDAPVTGATVSPGTVVETETPDDGRGAGDPAGGAPTHIKITDRGESVTITWVDPAGGTASFLVTGWREGGGQTGYLGATLVPADNTTATYTRLDPHSRYCFVVGTVYTVNNVAKAAAVCTDR